MSSEFKPSIYQDAIFDWITRGTGNAIIEAVAGSGKTTTLVEASKLVESNNILFAAFNKHIVETLKKRLPENVYCRTIHSIGYRCLMQKFGNKKIEPKENKYRAYCRTAAKSVYEQLEIAFENKLAIWQANGSKEEDLPDTPPSQESIRNELETLINFSRCTLTDPESLDDMRDLVIHFSVDCVVPLEDILYLLKYILDTGEADALDNQIIDFTDMLWLPFKWNLQPPKFAWILVDEAQDLNAAQLHLINKMAGDRTRLIFVGDPSQAIYGFSGADSESFFKIKDATNASVFPLSICYRCPAKIVALAKTIVNQIEQNPDCIEGEITEIKEDTILTHIKERDLILCRSTEPLVKLYFKLLASKKNAKIKGKDVGKTLISIVKEVEEQKEFVFSEFAVFLEKFAENKIFKLLQKQDNEKKIIDFTDQIESIAACFNSFNCQSAPEFRAELENLFSDDKVAITLSTIHRTKGLEEDRVFILHYEKMPLKWENQKDWQFDQELNLKYVAITRAKQHLYLVAQVPDN